MLLIAAVWNAAPSVVRAQDQAPIPSDIPDLAQTLSSQTATQEQKDQAAEKLASRTSAEAYKALEDALLNSAVPSAQSAAAKALAENPSTDPNYINHLFGILNTPNNKQSTIESAAMALSAYKGSPIVLDRLLAKATDDKLDEKIRVACIRALGRFVDRDVAKMLLDQLNPGKNSEAVVVAAEDALAHMTGLSASSMNIEQWKAWGNGIEGKSKDAFVQEVYRTRSVKYDQMQRQLSELQQDVTTVLREQYQATDERRKEELLLRFLRSEQYYFRYIGAQFVREEVLGKGGVSPGIKQQIRMLLSDSSPVVREQAASAIASINDKDSLDPILVQLKQETDSNVRAALARALGPIQSLRAVPLLADLLGDPNDNTVLAAAYALSDTGYGMQIRQKDPALADKVAEKLMGVLDKHDSPLNDIELRKTVAKAIWPVASPSIGKKLNDMVFRPNEQATTRRYLLEALGVLQDERFENAVASCMSIPDPEVKITAIRVYGKIAKQFQQAGSTLVKLMDKNSGEPEEVKAAAWETLKQLFKVAQEPELSSLAQKFQQDGDHVRRLAVLQAMSDRDKSDWKIQESIGESAFNAAEKDPQYYTQAIEAYKIALKGAIANNDGYLTEPISEMLTRSLLKAKKYQEAVSLVQEMIGRNPIHRSLGNTLRTEAESLMNESRDYQSAHTLINLALAMRPPLKEADIAQLNQTKEKVEAKMREHNRRPTIFDIPVNASIF